MCLFNDALLATSLPFSCGGTLEYSSVSIMYVYIHKIYLYYSPYFIMILIIFCNMSYSSQKRKKLTDKNHKWTINDAHDRK